MLANIASLIWSQTQITDRIFRPDKDLIEIYLNKDYVFLRLPQVKQIPWNE